MPESVSEPSTFVVPSPEPPDPNLVGVDKFEPSLTTLQRYYFTRKRSEDSKFREGGFKLPGLFDVQHYDRDRAMFIFAMVLELVGVACLGQVLYKASNLPQWSTVAIAAFFVLIDLILAYHHTGVVRGTQCQLENDRLKIFPPMREGVFRNRSLREYLELEAMLLPRWRVGLSAVLGALIIALAFVKAFVFYIHWQDIQLAQADAMGMPAPERSYAFVLSGLVLLSYFVVAIIHYRYTGYFLHAWRQRHNEKKDRRQRTSDSTKEYCLAYTRELPLPTMEEFLREATNPHNQHAEFNRLCPDDEKQCDELRRSTTPYASVVTRNRRHRIQRTADQRYKVTAYGLLRDEDLIELVASQPNATAKAAVTLYGHLLQLRIMESARPRDQETDLTQYDVRPRPEAA